MRKVLFFFLIFLNLNLFGNPIVIKVPVISEFFYNQGNWQIELCIKSEIYDWLDIQSFDQLGIKSNAGQVSFQTNIQFSYDSVYVIDQSWLSSTLIINPIQDNLNIICEVYTVWDGISYSPYPDTLVVSTPGADESIAVHYFDGSYFAYPMKQSPPSIGTSVFEVSSRSGISGYVYDQYQNPAPGISLDYYPSLYSWNAQPLHSIQTDSNGYFESDEIFPMGYYVELKMYNSVLETDMEYFEPDTSYYKEYVLNSAGVAINNLNDEINILAAPNPFTHKTTFHLSIPDELAWNDARITIRNINGRIIDFIPIANALWAGNDISVDWYTASAEMNIPPGLYLYTLEIDNNIISSQKMIINE